MDKSQELASWPRLSDNVDLSSQKFSQQRLFINKRYLSITSNNISLWYLSVKNVVNGESSCCYEYSVKNSAGDLNSGSYFAPRTHFMADEKTLPNLWCRRLLKAGVKSRVGLKEQRLHCPSSYNPSLAQEQQLATIFANKKLICSLARERKKTLTPKFSHFTFIQLSWGD